MLRVPGYLPRITRSQVPSRRCKISTEPPKPEKTVSKPPAPQPTSPAVPHAAGPSSSGPPPKKGGIFGKLLGLTVLGTGGTVGYAWYDPKFRKQVEDNVPYTKEALAYAYQYLPETKGDIDQQVQTKKSKAMAKPVPEKSSTSSEEKSLLRKKDVTPATPKKGDEKSQDSTQAKDELESKKKADAALRIKEKELAEEKNKQEEERVQRVLQEKQAEEAAENAALESILTDTVKELENSVKLAIDSQKDAAKTTKEHSQIIKKAMDSDELSTKESQWAEVSKVLEQRQDAFLRANKLEENTRLLLEKVKIAVEDGKSNVATKGNKVIRDAEEEMAKFGYQLDSAVAELRKAEGQAKVMAEYRDLVKKGKEQFKKELESVMPDVKIGKRFGGKLTEDELNSLIAHAHRRIEQLQKQLLEQQVLEQNRIEAALDRQREEDQTLSDDQLVREEQRLKNEFRLEKQIWDAEERIKFEGELRKNLARQAAAHSDHLAEVLKVQDRELEAKFQVLLNDKILEERDSFNTDVAGHIARLKGIEQAVDARADLEKQGRKAQELWLACQTLQNFIVEGKPEAVTPEQQLKPLSSELKAIGEASNNHPFVEHIIEAFPQQAAERGVWTEDSLLERFQKVHAICRRVALVDETGASLYRYFISYLQSMFVFASKPIGESDDIQFDSLNTFKLLDNAKHYVEKGDLEQALRFMNQLKGEPRRAAMDWVEQARLLLEARQATNVLLAHASAAGLGSLQ